MFPSKVISKLPHNTYARYTLLWLSIRFFLSHFIYLFSNVVDDELHLHAVKTLGKVYRSIYTVAADREYVIDTLIGIACASNIPRGMCDLRVPSL